MGHTSSEHSPEGFRPVLSASSFWLAASLKLQYKSTIPRLLFIRSGYMAAAVDRRAWQQNRRNLADVSPLCDARWKVYDI
jgi:hypothetical protein